MPLQQNFLCPNCKQENAAGNVYCAKCGIKLGALRESTVIVCSRCGTQGTPGARFCGMCGTRLDTFCPNCGSVVPWDSRYCPNCAFLCGEGRPKRR
ncbi:MAG: zinc ribbon domain-containing protein [Dehalococcoidia bacterium]|nr:zinc ribbon domain-containing protein [Dehalococcoidia bacterium]MDD5494142.1 zinc ribbon domain-containing protein [Dehalococcoidia bacterium]